MNSLLEPSDHVCQEAVMKAVDLFVDLHLISADGLISPGSIYDLSLRSARGQPTVSEVHGSIQHVMPLILTTQQAIHHILEGDHFDIDAWDVRCIARLRLVSETYSAPTEYARYLGFSPQYVCAPYVCLLDHSGRFLVNEVDCGFHPQASWQSTIPSLHASSVVDQPVFGVPRADDWTWNVFCVEYLFASRTIRCRSKCRAPGRVSPQLELADRCGR